MEERGGKIQTRGWLELGGNTAGEKNATKSMYMQPGGQLLYPIIVIEDPLSVPLSSRLSHSTHSEETPAAVYTWRVKEWKEKKDQELVLGRGNRLTQASRAGRIKTAQMNESHVTGSVKMSCLIVHQGG